MTLRTTAYASLAALALTASSTALAQDTVDTMADPTVTAAPIEGDDDDDSGKWGLLGLLGLAGLLGLKRRDDDRDHLRADRTGTGTNRS